MKRIYEVLFQDGKIEQEKWRKLIFEISKYHGIFHSWKLILQIVGNEIHYFVETKYPMNPTMNNLTFFCFQEQTLLREKKYQSVFSTVLWKNENFLEFYDKSLLKKEKRIDFIEFQFFPQNEEKIWHRAFLYYEENGFFYKSKFYLLFVDAFLSFDYAKTNRFVFKKIPKYFNVQKYLSLFQEEEKNAFFQVFTFPYQRKDSYLSLEQYDFFKHSFVLGSSGSGKSKFLSSFVAQIGKNESFQKQYKVIMIDPHASMVNDIGGLPNTSVIDFCDTQSSIDLFSSNQEDVISWVELYLSLFQMLMSDVYNSKLERVLRFSFQLLFGIQKFSFQNFRNLLLDSSFRSQMINDARASVSKRVIEFFMQDFYDIKTKYYGETLAPIISFLDEMQSLPAFQNDLKGLSFESLIEENFLNLISLDRATMGDHITKTIAGFLMCQLLNLISSKNFPCHLIFIVDEVAVIENPILCRFLSEARKYHLSVILVSQYFNQISEGLKNAILANVINYYLFRVSPWDAKIFVNHFNMSINGADTEEEKIKILTELTHREGIFRLQKDGKLLPSMKIKTLDFQPVPYKKDKKTKEKEIIKESKKLFSFQSDFSISLKEFLKTISTSHKKVRDSYE